MTSYNFYLFIPLQANPNYILHVNCIFNRVKQGDHGKNVGCSLAMPIAHHTMDRIVEGSLFDKIWH